MSGGRARMTLILGGARSGKSTHVQHLVAAAAADSAAPVLFVATASAGDAEMAERIATHRAERPPSWRTLEASTGVGTAVAAAMTAPPPAVVIVDCVTLLVSNVLLAAEAAGRDVAGAIDAEVDALLAAAHTGAHWLVVSNEVGLGVVPATRLGRDYRDHLGRANQRIAAAADTVLLMVAGIPLTVKEP